MEDRLEPLSAARAWALPPRQVVAELDMLAGWMVQAQAAFLARIRELDVQDIYRGDGATSAAVWLRNRYRMALPTARAYVKLAAAVDGAPDAVREAVAGGEVNLEQAKVIVDAVRALPRDVELRDLAGKELVKLADDYEPAELKQAGETILRVVDPDAGDEVERTALERAEAGAYERRGFTVSRDRSGVGYRISGHVTDEGAAVIRAAIEPLANPTRPGGSAGAEAVGEASRGPVDTRTATQRRADALVEVCRLALNTTELPADGGDRPQVVVNINYDILAQELGAGTLDNGDRVTPDTARRMACDCRLLPIVFDGLGQPLDVGRSRRLVGAGLRRAVAARDGGCAFPQCDRCPRWCDAHHVRPWAAGGPTALQNLALLCQAHHTEIHRPGGWTMYMAPDGFPTFVPPPHVDPQQKPTRNRYHRRT